MTRESERERDMIIIILCIIISYLKKLGYSSLKSVVRNLGTMYVGDTGKSFYLSHSSDSVIIFLPGF